MGDLEIAGYRPGRKMERAVEACLRWEFQVGHSAFDQFGYAQGKLLFTQGEPCSLKVGSCVLDDWRTIAGGKKLLFLSCYLL